MNEPQRSYYAIIPASVRYDERLIPGAKLLFGELASLCDEEGYCTADIDELHQMYRVSKNTIRKWMQSLQARGYTESESDGDIVSKLKSKNMVGLGFGDQICQWCLVKTSVLHTHHYPIPKALGGKETVDICPNCHHEFHYHSKTIKLLIPQEDINEIFKLRGEINEPSI